MKSLRALSMILLLSILYMSASAQQRERVAKNPSADNRSASEAPCARVYLGLSTGLNNNNGLLGFNVDVSIVPQFSVGAGVGLSTWGWKYFGEGRFYFSNKCNRGWALGAGITYNAGRKDVRMRFQTILGGKGTATVDFKPQPNAMFSAYRFINLGARKVNRLHFQLGYSIPLGSSEYVVKKGNVMSNDGIGMIRTFPPGGLILGFGLSFTMDH